MPFPKPIIRTAAIAAVFFLLAPAAARAAAPKAVLWPRWRAGDPKSSIRIGHSAWGAFLGKYFRPGADGVNRIAYGAVSREDEDALARYIARLEAAPVSRLRRNIQFAYWVNLYNALTVKLVLDHYPVGSITDISISPGWFTFGPWDKKLLTIEGERVSLNDIEHRILRPIWRDPRIHYAVSCASLGCPNLQPTPYTPERADAMLTEGARAYVNHPRGAHFSFWGLTVSSIYHWHKEDFGGTDAGVISHMKKYAAPALAARLEKTASIAGHDYDWSLNEADAAGARPGQVN